MLSDRQYASSGAFRSFIVQQESFPARALASSATATRSRWIAGGCGAGVARGGGRSPGGDGGGGSSPPPRLLPPSAPLPSTYRRVCRLRTNPIATMSPYKRTARGDVKCLCTVHGCKVIGRIVARRTAQDHDDDEALFLAGLYPYQPHPTARRGGIPRPATRQDRASPRPHDQEDLDSAILADVPCPPSPRLMGDSIAPVPTNVADEAVDALSGRGSKSMAISALLDGEDGARRPLGVDGGDALPAPVVTESVFEEIDSRLEEERVAQSTVADAAEGEIEDEVDLVSDRMTALATSDVESEAPRPSTKQAGVSIEQLLRPCRFVQDLPALPSRPSGKPSWVYIVYLSVAHLAGRFGASIAAISFLLSVIALVVVPETTWGDQVFATSLALVRQSLGLYLPVVRYVVCPNGLCLRLHPPGTTGICLGRTCQTRLDLPSGRKAVQSKAPQRGGGDQPVDSREGTSKLSFAYLPVTIWLQTLLGEDGIVERLQEWRERPCTPGVRSDVYDGDRWRSETEEGGFLDDEDSLNLFLNFYIDWFHPYTWTKTYSCGPLVLTILNLPPDLRYHPAYTHLVGVVPGPKAPDLFSIRHVLAPLVYELQDLDIGFECEVKSGGVKRTVRVRARLFFNTSDTPARALVGGFRGHSAETGACPWCTTPDTVQSTEPRRAPGLDEGEHRTAMDQSTGALDGEILRSQGEPEPHQQHPRRSGKPREIKPRDSIAHRQASLGLADCSRSQHLAKGKDVGAYYSVLHELAYWQSVRDCPLDAMHAIDNGIVRRFWHRLLIDAGGLKAKGKKELRKLQSKLRSLSLPSSLRRLPGDLGDPAGGSPTSEQYATLARFLPMILMAPDLWSHAVKDFHANEAAVIEAQETSDRPPGCQNERLWSRLQCGTSAVGQTTARGASGPAAASRDAPLERHAHVTGPAFDSDDDDGDDQSLAGSGSARSSRTSTPAHSASPSRASTPAPGKKKAKKSSQPQLDRYLHKGWLLRIATCLGNIVALCHRDQIDQEELALLRQLLELHWDLVSSIPFDTINTHAVLHLPNHIAAFGPARVFWAYVGERVNDKLKRMRAQSNLKAAQTELSMVRLWFDRVVLNQRIRGAALPPKVSVLFNTTETPAHVDRKVVRPPAPNTIETGRSIVPPGKHRLVYGGHNLPNRVYSKLLALLQRERQPGEALYVRETVMGTAQPGTVEVENAARFVAWLTVGRRRFTSVNGRSHAALGDSFAVTKMDREDYHRPSQVMDIIVHERTSASTGGSVSETFVWCKVFELKPVEEWQPLRPNPRFPYLGTWLVYAERYDLQLLRPHELVSNAIVVQWDDNDDTLAFQMYS